MFFYLFKAYIKGFLLFILVFSVYLVIFRRSYSDYFLKRLNYFVLLYLFSSKSNKSVFYASCSLNNYVHPRLYIKIFRVKKIYLSCPFKSNSYYCNHISPFYPNLLKVIQIPINLCGLALAIYPSYT